MGLLDDAKSSVSKWFEEQVAKNKAFKAAGGMGKSNPAMARSMGLLPATGLLEQEGDAAARADAAYGALRKEYGPLGLRPGDFVPFASGGLAIDDARLAAAKGNYGQAAGSLAGVIPVAGAFGKVVRKITGGKSSGVIDSVKREMIHTKKGRIPQTYAETEKFRDSFNAPMKKANLEIALGDSNVSPSRYIAASDDDMVSTLVDFRFSNHGDKNGFGGFSVDPKTGNTYEEAVFLAQKNGINMGRAFTIAKKKYPELAKEYGYNPDSLGIQGGTGSGLLNPEITKATNRGLYRTMLDDEEDKPSFPYGLIGK